MLISNVLSLLFVIAFKEVNAAPVSSGEENLISALVIFRHGERTPIEMFSWDPWNDEKFWPVGFKELTNRGKMQQFELGQWLRQRYSHLVTGLYNHTNIHVVSSDQSRTIMSALSNLAGFYPPVGTDVWNKGLMWQPIPVNIIPKGQDNLLASDAPCAAYDREMKRFINSEEYNYMTANLESLYDYLGNATGVPVRDISTVSYIYDDLMIEESFNLSLPDWAAKVYPHPLKEFSDMYFGFNAYTSKLAKFKSGPLMQDIIHRFTKKALRNLNENYVVYSAHDTTIANMLNLLGYFKLNDFEQPPYASALMFELYEENDAHYVKVFYKNSTAEPLSVSIGACGERCNLMRMINMFASSIPDWDEECNQSELMIFIEENKKELLKYSGIAGLAIVVVILVAVVARSSKKAYKRLHE